MIGSRAEKSMPTKRWSARVTRTSNALDLERAVFSKDPKSLARSLYGKSAARRSRRTR
jgi:uncharacterized protein DUF3175